MTHVGDDYDDDCEKGVKDDDDDDHVGDDYEDDDCEKGEKDDDALHMMVKMMTVKKEDNCKGWC